MYLHIEGCTHTSETAVLNMLSLSAPPCQPCQLCTVCSDLPLGYKAYTCQTLSGTRIHFTLQGTCPQLREMTSRERKKPDLSGAED